jgi:hypothetical protein
VWRRWPPRPSASPKVRRCWRTAWAAATTARVMSSHTRSMATATVSIATTARDMADSTWIWPVAHDRSWWLLATAVDLEGGSGGSGGSPSTSNLSCSGKPYPPHLLVLDLMTSLTFLLTCDCSVIAVFDCIYFYI